MYDLLNSNLTSIFNRSWDITRKIPPLFQMELEKDGWEYVDKLCQGAHAEYWTIQP